MGYEEIADLSDQQILKAYKKALALTKAEPIFAEAFATQFMRELKDCNEEDVRMRLDSIGLEESKEPLPWSLGEKQKLKGLLGEKEPEDIQEE